MRRIYLICLIILVFSGCKKEKELLTGDIIGKITVYNQDLLKSSDNSGVKVSLLHDNILQETSLTDRKGLYHFENIAYGKYTIDLQKDSFVKNLGVYTFNHVGGKSPSIWNGYISEIPDYVINIDSVRVQYSNGRMLLYFKTNGNVEIPAYYFLIGFCGDNPSVSKDDYSFILTGYVVDKSYPEYYNKADAVMTDFYKIIPSTLMYVRFYLLTNGQSIYSPVNIEALGNPSNVMSFIWQ